MGGTGKGHLIINLGLSLAIGQKVGPFKPARKFKVLYIAGVTIKMNFIAASTRLLRCFGRTDRRHLR